MFQQLRSECDEHRRDCLDGRCALENKGRWVLPVAMSAAIGAVGSIIVWGISVEVAQAQTDVELRQVRDRMAQFERRLDLLPRQIADEIMDRLERRDGR